MFISNNKSPVGFRFCLGGKAIAVNHPHHFFNHFPCRTNLANVNMNFQLKDC